jgi:hypothetical protein
MSDTLEHIECEQYSPEWWAARLGLPTASEFKTIIGVKKDARDKITRKTYMLKLAGERLTGRPKEAFSNEHTERGRLMEAEAVELYALTRNCEPKTCGFFRLGEKGCSPDRLLGDDGILSIKTALEHILIDYILKDQFPPEHKAQAQGELWITGRAWCDIAVYCPGLPLFVKRCEPDPHYIANLAEEVDRFNFELGEIVERVRRYGGPSRIKDDLKASLAALDAQEPPAWA